MDHLNFWWGFIGKVGAPIFSATLVACLLSGEFDPLHGILMVTGTRDDGSLSLANALQRPPL